MHCISSFHLFSHMSISWLHLNFKWVTMPSICCRSWLGMEAGLPGKFWLAGTGGSFAFIKLIKSSPLWISGCPKSSSTDLLDSCSRMRLSVSVTLLPSWWVSRSCSSSSNLSSKEMASSEILSISWNAKHMFLYLLYKKTAKFVKTNYSKSRSEFNICISMATVHLYLHWPDRPCGIITIEGALKGFSRTITWQKEVHLNIQQQKPSKDTSNLRGWLKIVPTM